MSKNTRFGSSSNWEQWSNLDEPLNRTYLGKNCILIFWVLILSHPKAITDMKNSLYYSRVKDMKLSPSSANCSKDSWKLLLLLISINWPSLVTWWVVIQKIYSKMHPVSCTNTHDVADLPNHGMAKNTKTWKYHENRTTFLRSEKILNLCFRWNVFEKLLFSSRGNLK